MARIAASMAALLVLHGAAGADSSRTGRPRISSFLVSIPGEGVFLYGLKGQVLWSHRCDPYDAVEGPRGWILITDRRAGRVFAVTREGQVAWQKLGLLGPVNAEALANGNVLVVENDSGRVLEISPEGDVAREFQGHRTPFDARRRPNGNVIVADSGNNRIREYDLQGRLVRETAGLRFPNGLFVLSNNRTLFTTYTNGTVAELDAGGAIVWEKRIGGTLYSVEAEGDTLWVSDGSGGRVLQITREGTTVREIRFGKTFVDLAFCR